MSPSLSRAGEPTTDEAIAEGLDEAMVRCVVHRFYDQVRADPLIGPVFHARVAEGGAIAQIR